MGGLHPTVEALKENPLDMIPLPTPDNPHYIRIMMERSKIERENEKIRQSHRTLMLQYWTEIYNHLMSCCALVGVIARVIARSRYYSYCSYYTKTFVQVFE